MRRRLDRMDTSGDGAYRFNWKGRPVNFYGRQRRYKPTVRRVQRQVNQLRRAITSDVERKEKTGQIGLNLVADTPQYTSLPLLEQGTTADKRIGNKIKLVSYTYKIKLNLLNNETNGAAVRLVIIYDRRPNGAEATWTDIFNASHFSALLNLDKEFSGRFQILHDQVFTLDVNGPQIRVEKGHVKINKITTYNGVVGDITDVQSGNLMVALYATANDQNVAVQGYHRLRYIDA